MSKIQPIITLITDFGLQDGYVGVMKGVMVKINPSVRIIDISNSIEPQDIFQAACVLNDSFAYFPKGTIHVVVVDPGVGSRRKIICLKTKDYLFLAPDNGVLSFIIAREKSPSIREVTNKELFLPKISNTFHGRDIFAPIAAHLSNGLSYKDLGKRAGKIKEIDLSKPIRSPGGVLKGEIIYVDGFGNLITNINRDIFSRLREKSGKLAIIVGRKKLNKISNSYADVGEKEVVAIFGSSGYLEISVNHGNAKNVLNLKKGDKLVLGYG
ncbi:MAG: S-adenosyl-l-methionine hydroxide adenosyltransferase family protein [Candidatus Scalinduaceae bacterium]